MKTWIQKNENLNSENRKSELGKSEGGVDLHYKWLRRSAKRWNSEFRKLKIWIEKTENLNSENWKNAFRKMKWWVQKTEIAKPFWTEKTWILNWNRFPNLAPGARPRGRRWCPRRTPPTVSTRRRRCPRRWHSGGPLFSTLCSRKRSKGFFFISDLGAGGVTSDLGTFGAWISSQFAQAIWPPNF